MKYAITNKNAYFDYGESNFIPKESVVEILDNFFDTKVLVMYNGFKRMIKKEDIVSAYVLLTFDNHEKISLKYITNPNKIHSLDYYIMPRVFEDYNEECLNNYKRECLKVLFDDKNRLEMCLKHIDDVIQKLQ